MNNNYACTGKYRPSFLNGLILSAILIATSLLVSPHAHAATKDGTHFMIVNGRSYHIEKAPEGQTFNENNFGSGFQYDFAREFGSKWVPFVTASAFNDSFNNLSYYVGGGESRRFFIKNGWHADLGYVAFLMARKDFNDYKPFPGVLPVASIGTGNVSLNMTYVPNVNDTITELLFFQLKVSIE